MPNQPLPGRHRKPSRKAYNKKWCREKYASDPDFRAARARALRNAILRKKYGITCDDYDRMLAEQGGRCAICGRPPAKRRLAVDHDHKTGQVRGLLCFKCNYGLGYWRDQRDQLLRAYEYLTRWVKVDVGQSVGPLTGPPLVSR